MLLDVLLLLPLLAMGPAQGADEAARRILQHDRYQTELPAHASERPGGNGRGPIGRRPEGKSNGGEALDPYAMPRRSSGGTDLSVVLWVLAAVVAITIIVSALGSVRVHRRDVELLVAPEPPPEVELTHEPLEEAEKLAAAGRFDDAIRALLHLTFAALRGVVPTDSSLTSREILRKSRLPDAPRKLLENLVAAVERSLFARRPVREADYESCVTEYRDLLAVVAKERT